MNELSEKSERMAQRRMIIAPIRAIRCSFQAFLAVSFRTGQRRAGSQGPRECQSPTKASCGRSVRLKDQSDEPQLVREARFSGWLVPNHFDEFRVLRLKSRDALFKVGCAHVHLDRVLTQSKAVCYAGWIRI